MMKIHLIILLVLLTSCDLTTAEENLGKAYEYTDYGKYKKAITELDKAINKVDNYRPALYHRAFCKTKIKDLSGAINDYKKIFEFSDCALCAYNIAKILNDNKQYKKSIEILSATLATEGVLKNGDFHLPNVNFFVDNIDYDTDYEIKEEYIYFERGLAYFNSGQFKNALKDFEKTTELNFCNIEGFYRLGEVYMNLGDTIKACENFKKSKKLGNKKAMEKVINICNENNN